MVKEDLLQIIDVDGTYNSKLEPKLPEETLLRGYRNLVLVRVLDSRMLSLPRQGRVGFFVPSGGGEAGRGGRRYGECPRGHASLM